MARCGSTRRSSWPGRRGVDAPRDWAGMSRGAHRADAVRVAGRAAARVRPADRAACRTPRRSSGSPPSSSRPRPPTASATSRSAGDRCSTSPGGLSLADGIAAVCRGAAGGGAPDRDDRPAHLHGAALARPRGRTSTLAETAARFRDQGLTGWDLAGPEEALPGPAHACARRSRRPAPAGLRITLHAGEWGGAAQVRRALALDPERIAHGPGAVDDPDAVRRADRPAASRSTCARPRTGRPGSCRPSRRIPLARLAPGRRARSRSTPTTRRSPTSPCPRSTCGAVEPIGLTLPELWAIDRHALDVAFADEADLARLRAEFAAWGAGIPELARAVTPTAGMGQARSHALRSGDELPGLRHAQRRRAASSAANAAPG